MTDFTVSSERGRFLGFPVWYAVIQGDYFRVHLARPFLTEAKALDYAWQSMQVKQ